MDSIQITIDARGEAQEILVAQLSELGADGFEQNETTLIAYFGENLFPKTGVEELLADYRFQTDVIKEQNWNKVWEGNFEPVMVDDFCLVRAEFHPAIAGCEHEIVITPKMSFGTGHHATTYMMLQQMRDINFKSKKVFDFGTGTGILAIMAEKLGASQVLAIDIDEWSITNANENVSSNNCTKIMASHTTIIPSQTFDIILANINRNVILEYLSSLKKILTPGGKILFSGLLISDQKEIVEACENQGLRLLKQAERTKWICLLFVN